MPRRRWTDPLDTSIRPDRKVVPDALAAKLKAASIAADEAKVERDRLIVVALKGGASAREIGHHVGLSATHVRRIGLDAGWPDAAEKKRREQEKEAKAEERRKLDEMIEQYQQRHGRRTE